MSKLLTENALLPEGTVLSTIVPDGPDGMPEGVVLRCLDGREENHSYVTHYVRVPAGRNVFICENGRYFEGGLQVDDLQRAIKNYMERRRRVIRHGGTVEA